MTRPLRIAHRGDWRQAPENSLEAIIAAMHAPACDGVEFDVRAARDGTPILLHDPTLWRVQRRRGRADRLSVEELAAAGVPTLDATLAALDALPRRAWLDIELKGDPGPAVIDVVEAHRGPELEAAVLSSFDIETLRSVHRARPRWPIWLNTTWLSERTVALARELGCSGVSVRWFSISDKSLARARAAGLDVCAWTIRDVPTLERMAAFGVTVVCVEGAALDG